MAQSGHAATVLSDGLTDGARTNNGADPLDTAWFTATVTTPLTVVDDSAGIGNGNALSFANGGAAFKVIVGALPTAVTLANGESISLSFTFRWTGTTNLNTDARLRFGLFNDNGTPVAGDNGATADDFGYFAATNPGLDNAAKTSMSEEIAVVSDSILTGAGQTPFGVAGQSFNFGTTTGTALFTISRTGTTLNFSASINGGAAATGTDTTAQTFTFNEIGFSNGGGSAPSTLLLDNIVVEYVPEPSSLALALLALIPLGYHRRRK